MSPCAGVGVGVGVGIGVGVGVGVGVGAPPQPFRRTPRFGGAVVIKSVTPSTLMSPVVTQFGAPPTKKVVGAPKAPKPSPNRTATLLDVCLMFAVAISFLPSPLKSPAVIDIGPNGAENFVKAPKVPSPFPSRNATNAGWQQALKFVTARSFFAPLFKAGAVIGSK